MVPPPPPNTDDTEEEKDGSGGGEEGVAYPLGTREEVNDFHAEGLSGGEGMASVFFFHPPTCTASCRTGRGRLVAKKRSPGEEEEEGSSNPTGTISSCSTLEEVVTGV